MENLAQNSKLEALLNLLDDPDVAIYEQIKNELLLLKTGVKIAKLQKLFDKSESDFLKIRITEILDVLKIEKLKDDIYQWSTQERADLLEGLFLIAEFGVPEFDRDSITETLTQITEKVRANIADKSTVEIIHTLNQVILYDFGFNGDIKEYNQLNNSFINRVFVDKRSNPIGLSTIYLLVAQKLELPIIGINSPGHFILGASNNLGKNISVLDEVDFFVNPFNNGNIIDKYSYLKWIKDKEYNVNDATDFIANNKIIIRRILNNLIYTLFTSGDRKTAEQMLKITELIE
jgi:regulator of sirC expression with transglutaminase-like and TPR domain